MNYVELPEDFRAIMPEELCLALDSNADVSVRLNPRKPFETKWNDTVSWCAEGRYLAERPIFTLDPAHAAGGYYVQEASSMATGSVAQKIIEDGELPSSGIIAVDLCAAPGGKTTHLSSVVGSRGVVVANEVIKARAGILNQNVVRWGEGNTIVTSVDSALLGEALSGSVDLLVIDAPCSGEGMFRKDYSARSEWSMDNVELCAARQRRIIAEGTKMLKCGGYLIYSTCTFNSKEDEDNVRWMIDSGDFELCQNYTASIGSGGELGSHFYPHEVRGEGFFIAVLQFVGSNRAPKKNKNKRGGKAKISQYSTMEVQEIEHGGKIYGYSPLMSEVVEMLQAAKTYILSAGIEFGELIRGELKPSHNFALYSYKAPIFNAAELPLEVAQEYLRKGAVDADYFENGLQIASYNGLPLGFAKRIDRRVNNMYPTSWRIMNL